MAGADPGLTADLVTSRWRMWLAFAVLGSAMAFAYRGDWAQAAAAGALVLARAAWLVRGEFEVARSVLLESAQPEGRHRRRDEVGLTQPYVCSRCGEAGVTTWDDEGAAARGRRLGLDLVCDACLIGKLRLAAALGGAGR